MAWLRREAARFGVQLTERQLEQFGHYQALLLAWNERMNLTAITAPADIQLRHFLDSLSCVAATGDLNGRRLVDVGTGAGLPGLPLKIAFPQMELCLVDSVAKKTRFLAAVVAELELAGVTVVAERAEALGQDQAHRGRYDWAVARSVAELRVLVEYLLPLVTVGGRALAMKGKNAPAEAAAAARAIAALGGGPPVIAPVQLPLPGPETEFLQETPFLEPLEHFLVVIEKVKETPARYPRRPGMAAKRPLV